MAGTVRIGGVRVDMSLGTAELQKSIQKAKGQVDTFAKGMKTALTAAAGYLTVRGLESFTKGIVNLAREGDRLGDLEDTFRSLGGSLKWVDQAKEKILGTAASSDILAASNKMLVAGLRPTQDQFVSLIDYAARYAQATGGDLNASLEKVSGTILKGSKQRLAQLGFHVEGKTAAERQAQALAQLGEQTAKLAPISADTATAADALGAAWKDFTETAGKAANNNALLRDGLNDLSDAIRSGSVDDLVTLFSNVAGAILEATSALANFISSFKQAAGMAKAQAFQSISEDAKSAAMKFEAIATAGAKTPENLAKMEQLLREINHEIEVNKGGLKGFLGGDTEANAAFERLRKDWSGFYDDVNAPVKEDSVLAPNAGAALAGNVDKAAEAVKKLREQLAGAQSAAALTGLQDQAAKLPFGDTAGLSSLSTAIAANVREGVISGLQDSIDAGGPEARRYAEELAKLKADEEVAALNTTVKDAWENQITELVGFWQNVFENAITGEKFNLEDMFKQLAVGFAAQLAAETSAAMFGVDFFEGISSPQQAGMTLAQIFLGGSDLKSVVGAATGGGSGGLLSSIVGGAAGAGIIGSASLGGIAEGFGAGLTGTAIAPTSAAAGTAMSVGSTVAAVAPYAAAAVAAYVAADHFGMFGGQTSKEELARRGFSEWMTEQFSKLSTAAFFDGTGKLQMGSAPGFQFDVSDKDVKRAQGYFEGLDSEAQGTFSALGTALKRLAGLTEQESANIAAALSEDLVGNIDNARLLVYQLGLSFEDLKGAILEAAKAGEIRWSEYNAQIAGLADAFEPGLKAVGAYGDAFQNLIDSGGRGMAALKAVQDTAVEGMEAGLTTVDQLGEKLKEQGLDPEWVDAYISAIKSKGITTLEELKNADQETMGQIVGNMESASESLGKSWQKMGEDIDSLSKKLDELNGKKADAYVKIHYSEENKPEGTESIIPGTTPPAEPEVKSAMGNVFDSPTVSLLGEAGPEAIMPLKRINGRLGVMTTGGGGFSAVNINVDARGAQRGVSSEVVAAISAMGQAAVKRAVFEVVDGQQRGRF